MTLFERAPSLGLAGSGAARTVWWSAPAHGRRGLLPPVEPVSGRFCSYYESDGRLLLQQEW